MTSLLRRTSVASDLPAVGQLVTVRGRNWVVVDVQESRIPLDVTAASVGEGATFVTLSSVEDDGLGEELRVLWELEAGRRVLERATLPDVSEGRFDDPARLGAFLDALRWGAVTSAETTVLQAPFRAGISVEDYQLEPAIRALSLPRVNLLVADDVGLGKTIEAGLVVQELLLRSRVRRVMVVCPAHLTDKWHDEMLNRFGLDFAVVNSETLSQVRRDRGLHANPFKVYPYTIVSLAWLRGPKAGRLLDEVLTQSGLSRTRPLDLLIVDEAHHVAPPGKGQYAVDSQQTRIVKRLADHAEHRLFMSATPHNGYLESWTALLAMLDPQRFARGVVPDPAALKQILIRRLKTEITNADGTPRYPARQAMDITVTYPKGELEVQDLLARYTRARSAKAKNKSRKAGVDLLGLLLKKRFFSSPAAFASTVLAVRDNSVKIDLAWAPEGYDIEVDERFAHGLDEDRQQLLDADYADDDAVDEAELVVLTKAQQVAGKVDADEAGLLDELCTWAEQHGHETDAKAQALLAFLRETCLDDSGQWNDERVVVFTEYRDTQRWLLELLEKHGLAGPGRVELLYGGMDDDKRATVMTAFQRPPDLHPIRIILATDTASEGVDLQNHCHRLVNYDLPFNPNRLEQRAGRIDRYGQIRTPLVYHFAGSDWETASKESLQGDLQFLTIIARKIAAAREDLGSVNPVISDAVERRMLGRPARNFDIDRTLAKAKADPALKVERQLREETARLAATLDNSRRELHCTSADVERVVRTGLALGRQPDLTPEVRDGHTVFHVGTLTGSWARTVADLADRDYGQRPLSFDPGYAAKRDDVVLAHLNHPLVAMATRLLRAEVWGASQDGGQSSLARAASIRVEDPALSEEVLAAYSRLVVIGADGKRLHEELVPVGGTLRGTSFARLGVTELARILDATLGPDAHPIAAGPGARQALVEAWDRVSGNLGLAIEARAKERQESLTRALGRRRDDEVKRTTQLLDAFAEALRGAINVDSAPQQLSFADLEPDERQQLTADRAAWQERLDRLPVERAEELARIRGRYASVEFLTFPAAVVHLVPAGLDR
ncbi:DISARM system SNF2-like helicase DrmD [Geodermatophilus nigrescens]|uniref:Superfamily II DNA or RNA helicase, SNF2 family n=1 Tax=Geodermatophilus nigrescens TaxID=1070870 RepID=A0A1M5JPW0_9ACTN|nr:DISARM system SNF2-like helicase DrmD [Geodermatophilus nigrescens]SHG42622.1 Superfamily II DNA or RNA helicase, SNF2 family [Geodermatophilus nigrescens]